MTTYSETCGQAPFDWREALQNPPDELDLGARAELEVYAGDWVTCACGNQCAVIPRDECGRPIDVELGELGALFSTCITAQEWGVARRVIEDIERRSDEILAEMGGEK